MSRGLPDGGGWATWALVLAFAAGCSTCQRGPSRHADVTRVLPGHALGVVVIPDLDRLGEKLRMLAELKAISTALALQGLPPASEYISQLTAQLGVDFRSPQTLKSAGIDAQGGMGVVLTDPHRGYLVLAVSDGRRFRTHLGELARDQLGAGQTRSTTVRDSAVTLFGQGDSGPAALSLLVRGQYAFVALGDASRELAEAASLHPSQTLAQAPSFAAAVASVSARRDVWAHLAPQLLGLGDGPSGNVTFALDLSKGLLKADVRIPWPGVARDAPRKSPTQLLGFLPPDAFLVGRLGPPFGPTDLFWKRWFRSELNLQTQVFDALGSDVLIGVSLARTATLEGIMALDPRRGSPFRTLHVVGVAEVADLGTAQRVLDRLPSLAAEVGARVTPTEQRGRRLYVTSYARGEGLSFALAGDKVFAAAPIATLEETLDKGGRSSNDGVPDSVFRQPLEGCSDALVVDLRRLGASLRALPSSSWGVGGFAIKRSVENWLDALSELEVITLSATAGERVVEGELSLRFRAP